jgi:valyl-tRNA synthetase
VETLSILGEAANLPRSLSAVLPEAVAHLVVSEFLDVDAEIARLAQELEKLDKDMATSTKKLSNESFHLRHLRMLWTRRAALPSRRTETTDSRNLASLGSIER